MSRIALITVVAGASLATTAFAHQSLSTSMTECGAIYHEMGFFGISATNTPQRKAQLKEWSNAFFQAAILQMQKEGIADPQSQLTTEADRLGRKWEKRLSQPALLQENKDWLDYCRKMGRSKGVPLD